MVFLGQRHGELHRDGRAAAAAHHHREGQGLVRIDAVRHVDDAVVSSCVPAQLVGRQETKSYAAPADAPTDGP